MMNDIRGRKLPEEVCMRLAAFLLVLFLLTLLVMAQSPGSHSSMPAPASPQLVPGQSTYGRAGSMWRRAEIRIVPNDLLATNHAELVSLRRRVEQAKSDAARLEPGDPAVRRQLTQQIELMDAMLAWAERQDSDLGKSPTALDVQHHLNNIEGKVMCEACHGGPIGQGEPASASPAR